MIGYAVTGAAILIIALYIALRYAGSERIHRMVDDRSVGRIAASSLIVIFLALTAGTIAFGPELDRAHDIDDAIGAACIHFVHGGNPYKDEVVPRFAEIYHEGVLIKNGTLNYLPSTLAVYSGSYLALGFVGPAWFEFSNAIFGVLSAFALASAFPKARKGMLFPAMGIVTVFFIFDNIMLTVLFLCVALFFIVRMRTGANILFGLVFLFLAFAVKMAAMLCLGAFLIYLVQKYRLKDRKVNLQLALFGLFAASAALSSIALFGFNNLMDSTFLFMSDPSVRSDGAYFGGTILSEIVGDSPMFSILSYGILLSVLAGTMFVKGLFPRLFIAEASIPFVTVKDSQSLLAIPAILLFACFMASLDPDLEPASSAEPEVKRGR